MVMLVSVEINEGIFVKNGVGVCTCAFVCLCVTGRQTVYVWM